MLRITHAKPQSPQRFSLSLRPSRSLREAFSFLEKPPHQLPANTTASNILSNHSRAMLRFRSRSNLNFTKPKKQLRAQMPERKTADGCVNGFWTPRRDTGDDRHVFGNHASVIESRLKAHIRGLLKRTGGDKRMKLLPGVGFSDRVNAASEHHNPAAPNPAIQLPSNRIR
jgi:hypothetical protein